MERRPMEDYFIFSTNNHLESRNEQIKRKEADKRQFQNHRQTLQF